MDKFLTGLPRKRTAEDEPSPDVLPKQGKAKTRKYEETYVAFGFTCTMVGNEERPQCVVCLKILACDSLKPNKLRRHLETLHPEHKDKSVDFFRKKTHTALLNSVALLKLYPCRKCPTCFV